MITHVAIKDCMQKVWSLPKPNRHHDVIHLMCKEVDKTKGIELLKKHVQGFLDHKGEFLNRKSAWYDAKMYGQLLPPYDPTDTSKRRGKVNDKPTELFSEDIW